MNPLGAFNTEYLGMPVEDMASFMQSEQLTYVQLDPRVQEGHFSSENVTRTRAKHFRKSLADKGITIAALAGYTNLVDPDPEKLKDGLKTFESMIELCHEYGTKYIATETGSLNPNSPWEDDPANHTEEAWDMLMDHLSPLVKKARENGVTILLEGSTINVLSTIEQTERLMKEFSADEIGFVLDPFNYFTCEDIHQPQKVLDKVFHAIASRAPIAHAKDVVCINNIVDTPKVGAGQMDWVAYAAMLSKYTPTIPLILEHLKRPDIPNCKRIVTEAFKAAEQF